MDLRGIAEAYQSVYTGKQTEVVTEAKECCEECGSYDHTTKEHDKAMAEAIDLASDYFLEEGIDEEDLDIIIEDVGLDDFVEFVNEERAARRANVKAKSYAQVKKEVDAGDAARKKSGKGEYSAAYKKKETDVTNYGDDKPAKAKVKKAVAKTKAAKPAPKKVAKKDFDGDGKKESPKAEYKGSKDKAIKKAIAKKAPAKKKEGLVSKISSAYK